MRFLGSLRTSWTGRLGSAATGVGAAGCGAEEAAAGFSPPLELLFLLPPALVELPLEGAGPAEDVPPPLLEEAGPGISSRPITLASLPVRLLSGSEQDSEPAGEAAAEELAGDASSIRRLPRAFGEADALFFGLGMSEVLLAAGGLHQAFL